MSAPVQTLLGVVLIAVGVTVALTLPDQHFFIFTGRPFGVVLAIAGAVDLFEGSTRARRSTSSGRGA